MSLSAREIERLETEVETLNKKLALAHEAYQGTIRGQTKEIQRLTKALLQIAETAGMPWESQREQNRYFCATACAALEPATAPEAVLQQLATETKVVLETYDDLSEVMAVLMDEQPATETVCPCTYGMCNECRTNTGSHSGDCSTCEGSGKISEVKDA